MSFLSALKIVGKDLSHVGTWIEDGLKVTAGVVEVVDPSLAPLITEIESVFDHVVTVSGTLSGSTAASPLTAGQIQAIVTAVTTVWSLKSQLPASLAAAAAPAKPS